MGAHLIDGQFQSDKYPSTPRGKVPLSVKDPTAHDLLWEYAQRRRSVDAEFAADLEEALRLAGYQGPATERWDADAKAEGRPHGWRRSPLRSSGEATPALARDLLAPVANESGQVEQRSHLHRLDLWRLEKPCPLLPAASVEPRVEDGRVS